MVGTQSWNRNAAQPSTGQRKAQAHEKIKASKADIERTYERDDMMVYK
jgi:hypothetical protein